MPGDLRELTDRLSQPLAEGERADVEAQLGRRYHDAGEPEQALRYLSAARRRWAELGQAGRAASVDVDLAEVCATRGEHDRALSFLDRALDHAESAGDDELRASVQLLLGESALARGDLDGAHDLLLAARAHWDVYWNGGALARSAAALARVLAHKGALAEAQVFVDLARGDARAVDDPALTARVAMAAGELAERTGELNAAVACFRAAIDAAGAAGARRALAEAHLALGLVLGALAEHKAAPEAAAGHLALAQELFRVAGGLHDLERVRDAFRRFGRRATDRADAAELSPLLAELRDHRRAVQETAGRLLDLSARGPAAAPPAELRALEATVTGALRDLALAEDRFVAAVNAVVVDRENIRGLLDLVRQLAQVTSFAAMGEEVARLASHLVTADRVVADIAGGGRSALGVDAAAPGPWHDALAAARGPGGRPALHPATGPGGRASGRRTTTKLGASMTVPLRAGGRVVGAVWVDKEPSGGVFAERDLDLLTVFATQAATILENARITDELRLTARTTAATLEAIGDGVVAIDAAGAVTAINATATRLLGAPQSADRRTVLAVLGDAVSRGEELEGRAVALAAVDVVVTTRLVKDDRGLAVGLVATLTELRRASSLAQRMVGTSARYVLGDLVGRSPALRHVLSLAEAAAQSDAVVLITGESGTGKEVLAQAIHNASARAGGPFVAVNCAAIPRDLLESELFGYEAGAFTGARKGGRPGKFEIAEGGTLLLDEIGDMPLDMQAKLLRVLQEKTVSRLAGARELPLSCRIVATTNRDLDDEAQRGLFRRDLYYRLRVINIELPPLRERKGDIAALVDHFLRVYAARASKRLTRVSPQVMDALVAYPWPGNIRELEHVLESEVALATVDATVVNEVPVTLRERHRRPTTVPPGSGVPMAPMQHMPSAPTMPIGPAHPGLPSTMNIPQPMAVPAPFPATPPFGHALPMAYAPGTMMTPSMGVPTVGGGGGGAMGETPGTIRAVVDVERDLLVAALTRYRGRIPAVARALGWSRGTIYNKMRKYELDPDQFRDLP